jgi:cupredoxin-like protein
VTVKAGTRVTWTNHDDIPHTVISSDRGFKSKTLDTDEKFSFIPTHPGTYCYFCSIHPKMTAQIVVQQALSSHEPFGYQVGDAGEARSACCVNPLSDRALLAGVASDFGARWTKRATVAAAAYANLLVAAVSVPPVVASGILAWQWQLAGQRLRGVLLLHLVLGCVSGLLIGGVGCIHLRARRERAPRYLLTIVCSSSSWPFL